jgi:glycosyltransferase involved in cell wall biosynthesis
MKWHITSLGNANGSIIINERKYTLPSGDESLCFKDVRQNDSLSLTCENGKFSDTEDSFIFLYTEIDPEKNNIELSADVSVRESTDLCSRQSGYGIMAADTVHNTGRYARYRNQIMIGRVRLMESRNIGCGVRIVSGYRNSDGSDGVRLLDASRQLLSGCSDSIQIGESYCFSLRKENEGFFSCAIHGDSAADSFFPGSDFLTRQDKEHIYIGFAVARGLSVDIRNISCNLHAGLLSHTPDSELKATFHDYPFDRTLFKTDLSADTAVPHDLTAYVSPSGKTDAEGTAQDPLDLLTAVNDKTYYKNYLLADGSYKINKTLYISKNRQLKLEAEHAGKAVIDAGGIISGTPALIVHGSNCLIEGICVTGSPSVGIHICGNGNTIERCQTFSNKDTGILICSYPGEDKEFWPRENLVLNCDSFDNVDEDRTNADGFGAKLRIGEGNVFDGCLAHHNVDDGFDLYCKSIFGSIPPVSIRNCVSCFNGDTGSKEDSSYEKKCSGFKLGGENIAVRNTVENCIAYGNNGYGFSTNSNPYVQISNAISLRNRAGAYQFYTDSNKDRPDWKIERLHPSGSIHAFYRDVSLEKPSPESDDPHDPVPAYTVDHIVKGLPSRKENGSLEISRLFRAEETRDKTILFVVPRISGGGAEKVLASLASALSDHNRVYIVTTLNRDGNEEYPVDQRVTVLNLMDHLKPDDEFRLLKQLKKIIKKIVPSKIHRKHYEKKQEPRIEALRMIKKELQVDCSISFLNSANYLNARSKTKERCIISIRSYPDGQFAPSELRNEEGKEMLKTACDLADTVVSVSAETGSRMMELFGIDPEKSETIYNYCEVDEILAKSKEDPDETDMPIAHSDFIFINSGRLTEKKGQWHLIRAFSQVVKLRPEAKLIILGRHGKGDEDSWDLVKETIDKNGLGNHVFMPGFRINPYAYLAKSHAYVMTSFNEGFPNALAEAMALSLPVISTDCRSGPREILAPNTDFHKKTRTVKYAQYGILVPECSGNKLTDEPLEKEEEMLAEAMIRLIEDPEIREAYAIRSFYRARQFNKTDIIDQWNELIARKDDTR